MNICTFGAISKGDRKFVSTNETTLLSTLLYLELNLKQISSFPFEMFPNVHVSIEASTETRDLSNRKQIKAKNYDVSLKKEQVKPLMPYSRSDKGNSRTWNITHKYSLQTESWREQQAIPILKIKFLKIQFSKFMLRIFHSCIIKEKNTSKLLEAMIFMGDTFYWTNC